MSQEVQIECLKEIYEEGQCDELLTLQVEYEAPEYEMGYTRYVGGFYVDGVPTCPKCKLTDEDEADIIKRAIDKAQSDMEDYYDGPDCDDRDD